MITAREARNLSEDSFYDLPDAIDFVHVVIGTAARHSMREITLVVSKDFTSGVKSHLKEYGYKVVGKNHGDGGKKLNISWRRKGIGYYPSGVI